MEESSGILTMNCFVPGVAFVSVVVGEARLVDAPVSAIVVSLVEKVLVLKTLAMVWRGQLGMHEVRKIYSLCHLCLHSQFPLWVSQRGDHF